MLEKVNLCAFHQNCVCKYPEIFGTAFFLFYNRSSVWLHLLIGTPLFPGHVALPVLVGWLQKKKLMAHFDLTAKDSFNSLSVLRSYLPQDLRERLYERESSVGMCCDNDKFSHYFIMSVNGEIHNA